MIGKRVPMMKKKKPRTSKTSKKTAILNLDKGINDEYKTLLKNKGYDLPSEIFNEQKNVDDIIKKLEGKIIDHSTKKREPFKKLSKTQKNIL